MKRIYLKILFSVLCISLSSCSEAFLTSFASGTQMTANSMLAASANTGARGNNKKYATTTAGFISPTGSNDFLINQTGWLQSDGVLDNSIAAQDDNSSSSQSSTSRSSSSSGKQCPVCHGSGQVERNQSVGTYGINTSKKQCSTCGKWIMAGTAHSHTTCSSCHGKGTL